MKCPECGASLKKIPRRCTECGALLKKKAEGSLPKQSKAIKSPQAVSVEVPEAIAVEAPQAIAVEARQAIAFDAPQAVAVEAPQAVAVEAPQAVAVKAIQAVSVEQPTPGNQAPSLIEFPGINKNALPEWRKELSERVREKQERRAREALLETTEPATEADENTSPAPPMLELLPQTELPPLNPIVEAALKRIERAHLQSLSFSNGNGALATAIAYEEQQGCAESNGGPSRECSAGNSDNESTAEARPLEKTHNLAVVPKQTAVRKDTERIRKPKRLIGEGNDPALNYLDTVPTGLLMEKREYVAASTMRRATAAIIDLAILFALASPLLALNNLTTLDWQNWRVLAFSAGSLLLIGFLYLTIVTAFTGRTWGMRLCSLRVVDARNGLIPTGSQSAGRALIYLLSLASAGILSLYVFVDSERNALHDRFTRTAVIRV
ncbi:MAG: RDD family protein [bacterium]